jgi:hypothetical protein
MALTNSERVTWRPDAQCLEPGARRPEASKSVSALRMLRRRSSVANIRGARTFRPWFAVTVMAGEDHMRFSPAAFLLFATFCLLLTIALASGSAAIHAAEAAVTAIIAIGIAGYGTRGRLRG